MRDLESAIHRSSQNQSKMLETDDATLAFRSWLAHELSPSDMATSRHQPAGALGGEGGDGDEGENGVSRRPRVIVHTQMPPRRCPTRRADLAAAAVEEEEKGEKKDKESSIDMYNNDVERESERERERQRERWKEKWREKIEREVY